MRRVLNLLLALASMATALAPVGHLSAQTRQDRTTETAGILIRQYLQHRLEVTRRAPALRLCSSVARMVNAIDRIKLVSDGLAESVDTVCTGSAPDVSDRTAPTSLGISYLAVDADTALLSAVQLYRDRWSLSETARFTGMGGWYLTGINFGRLDQDFGVYIPFTTRTGRPPGVLPDSGR